MTKSFKLDIELPQGANEEWRRCSSYPLYEASNYGRIRRFGKSTDTVLQQRATPQGYAAVTLSIKGKVMIRMCHVLVLDAFVGPKPYQHFVQHIDGDKLNNALSNLRYVPGINSYGNAAANISHAAYNYLPPDHVWAITERGVPRFSATTLEGVLAQAAESHPESEVDPSLVDTQS